MVTYRIKYEFYVEITFIAIAKNMFYTTISFFFFYFFAYLHNERWNEQRSKHQNRIFFYSNQF